MIATAYILCSNLFCYLRRPQAATLSW